MRAVPVQNPPNRFALQVVEYEDEENPGLLLEVFEDHSRSILARNDSPDIPFRFTVNPYRGCQHACAYCYARPTHEYLGWGAGTDFDRRIVVKPHAPELLDEALRKRAKRGLPREVFVFSGVTDCYQPIERTYRLTRRCLEVCLRHEQPAVVVTKSAIVERDLDLFAELARRGLVRVAISVPFFDAEQARVIEPYAPTPQGLLWALERLARVGVPLTVNVAPVIPGLTESQMPAVLTRAREAGAEAAALIVLRLPGAARQVFAERVAKAMPLKVERILARTREIRGGELNDARFGSRMTGQGAHAVAIEQLFVTTARRLGLAVNRPWHPPSGGRAAVSASEQDELPQRSEGQQVARRRPIQLSLFAGVTLPGEAPTREPHRAGSDPCSPVREALAGRSARVKGGGR
jgi:DNA repair photolyase